MLIYYQLREGSLLPRCCFIPLLLYLQASETFSRDNWSYFNAYINADWLLMFLGVSGILLLLGLMLQCSSATFVFLFRWKHCTYLMNSCTPLPHQHIKLSFCLFPILEVCVHSACYGKEKRNRKQLPYIAAEYLLMCGTGTDLASHPETAELWTSRRFLLTSARYGWPADLRWLLSNIKPLQAFAPFRCDLAKTPAGKESQ